MVSGVSAFFEINEKKRLHDSVWHVECAPRFGDHLEQKASPSGGLTLKNKIKTDVWALVGMVVK